MVRRSELGSVVRAVGSRRTPVHVDLKTDRGTHLAIQRSGLKPYSAFLERLDLSVAVNHSCA